MKPRPNPNVTVVKANIVQISHLVKCVRIAMRLCWISPYLIQAWAETTQHFFSVQKIHNFKYCSLCCISFSP